MTVTVATDADRYLWRIGAVAAFLGALTLLVATFLHPTDADPSDPAAAFAEYAADAMWVGSHLGQFLGVTLLSVALIALGSLLGDGRARAWSRFAVVFTAAGLASGAALQAVDGLR